MEWKPVPVATSSTRSTPRSLSMLMKKSPSLAALASQSMSSSHFRTKLCTYSRLYWSVFLCAMGLSPYNCSSATITPPRLWA